MTFNEIFTDFLNITLTRDHTKRQYHMSQAAYVEALHEIYGYMDVYDICIFTNILDCLNAYT